MDHGFEFLPAEGYVVITTSGQASMDGFQQMHRDMVAHPGWKPGFNLLMDHRALDSSRMAGQDVERIALWRSGLSELAGTSKIAAVVETDLGFGLMRMWHSHIEDFIPAEFRIFRSLDGARQWLTEEPGIRPTAKK